MTIRYYRLARALKGNDSEHETELLMSGDRDDARALRADRSIASYSIGAPSILYEQMPRQRLYRTVSFFKTHPASTSTAYTYMECLYSMILGERAGKAGASACRLLVTNFRFAVTRIVCCMCEWAMRM
jgi:hypothetical protein